MNLYTTTKAVLADYIKAPKGNITTRQIQERVAAHHPVCNDWTPMHEAIQEFIDAGKLRIHRGGDNPVLACHTQYKASNWNAIFHDEVAPHMGYLAMRWQDEREYEDFDEYRTSLTDKILEAFPGAQSIVIEDDPFRCTFIDGITTIEAVVAGNVIQIVAYMN